MVVRRDLLKIPFSLGAYSIATRVHANAGNHHTEVGSKNTYSRNAVSFRMPHESAPHLRTWMQWPARNDDLQYLNLIREDLARLARTISQFEEVFMVARPEQVADASRLCGATVTIHTIAVDDMWARDSGPTFVNGSDGSQAIVDFNFNGWGNKQEHKDNTKIATNIASMRNIPRLPAALTTEGGAIEVDGDGTILTTESAVMNENRNPGLNKAELENHLNTALGTTKVIWLPGIRGQDITDGHIDLLARFIRPGLVLIELPPEGDRGPEAKMVQKSIEILKAATDARGRKFDVVILRRSSTTRSKEEDFVNSYINYYVCNGAVIMPQFGDIHSDFIAAETLSVMYPGRKIVQVNVDRICENGGGIHCVTQQQPRVI